MTPNKTLVALLFICIAAPTIALSQAKQQYDIPLGREIRPFDEYLLEASSQRISRMTVTDPNGIQKQIQDDTATVRISANIAVKAVTEDGQEAIKYVKIRHAELATEGETRVLAVAGTTLEATFSDSGTFITEKGEDLPIDVSAFLSSVIRSEGGLRTGDIMNAPGLITVGEEWKVNKEALINTLKLSTADSSAVIWGKVHFVGIDSSGKSPVARVELNARAENALDKIEGTKPTKSRVDMNVIIDVPLDKRYPIVYTRTRLRMMAQFGEGGGSAALEYLSQDESRFLR